jgi:hypothetical protein
MKFSLMLKSALNMMKHALYLSVVDFVHRVAEETFKAETSLTSLAEAIHKIFLQTFLVVVDAVARAKVKIYKPKPPLLFVSQFSVLI